MRRARIPASARSELADLESRSEPAEVERRLEQALPFVRRGTFEDRRLALAPDAGKFAGIRAGGRRWPISRRARGDPRRRRRPKFWRRGGEITARLASRPAPPSSRPREARSSPS